MPKFRISLCFSDTGGGHRSAVEAIDAGIKEVAASHSTVDNFEITLENIVEKTHPINRFFVDLYNFLLRHNQAAMKYYYWFIEAFKPNNSEIGFMLARRTLHDFVERVQPQVIVSVHPMSSHYLARTLRETDEFGKIKLITVVTDPNQDLWRGWACPEADLTIVPNDLVKDQLTKWQVAEEKIRVIGMPVHPDFCKPPTTSRGDFLHHLGLSSDLITVCINAGWAGGGNMLSIYRHLSRVKKAWQAVFICGHNSALYERATREAEQANMPTAVLPFHDRMSDLMGAVDLMVTKAGGLTTFEAIARKLPLALDVISEPMPQELGTVRMLVDQGLAYSIEKADDIVAVMESLISRESRFSLQVPAVHSLDRSDAVYEIARTVMSFVDPIYLPAPRAKIVKHG